MKHIVIIGIVIIGIGLLIVIKSMPDTNNEIDKISYQDIDALDIVQEEISNNELIDEFSQDGILSETGSMSESESTWWWVNSGAYFVVEGGIGRTIRGGLSEGDVWRKKYNDAKPKTTQDGFHPQNIFRLITKQKWQNMSEEVYFKITGMHKAPVEERGESNGVLLFGHYIDQDDLYYAGLRVDGQAVIKKKIKGKYETLAIEQIYEGEYDREHNENLLPRDKWIGLRMTVQDYDGDVIIALFIDKNKTGKWEQVLTTVDAGNNQALIRKGHAGIRTDFMDVEFENYIIKEIL